MSDMIQDCSDPNLNQVIETNMSEWKSEWGNTPYSKLHDEKNIRLLVTENLYHVNGNNVFLAKFTQHEVDEKINEIIELFDSRGLPFVWITGPASRPRDLGQHLLAHGLRHSVDMPSMAVELDKLRMSRNRPTDLEIKLVEDDDALNDWLDAFLSVYTGMARVRDWWFKFESYLGYGRSYNRLLYTGYLRGRPVASAFMFLGSGVAGIYCVGTITEARRKGIGSEITCVPLLEAREMGYKVGILHSSKMAYNIYSRMGFTECCVVSMYRWDHKKDN